MNNKRSTTSMAIALLVVSLISMSSIQHVAFAEGIGMSLTAAADYDSDVITVSGKTIRDITDITLVATSPSGNNIVRIDQITPDANGEYSVEFKIGPTWYEDGYYTIKAKQASSELLNVNVNVIDGFVAEKTLDTESDLQVKYQPAQVNIAADKGLEISADAKIGSNTIIITGTTDKLSQDIALTVKAPNGNTVALDQTSPNIDGDFMAVITTGGQLWSTDGLYSVTAQQSDDPNYTQSVEIDIRDGVIVPEFGTIAVMILTVAIISIIAISARSRLSIVPRY